MGIRKLETDILNWATAFACWINTQKSFVKFLNRCLMKSLLKEPEETPDGIVPFSPTRLGAPPIFITCNDWYNAIENVSEARVSKAMHDFASMLNQLGKKLDEERRQRLKVEYRAKDSEKRVRTLYEESGMDWEQYVLSNNAAAAEVTTESRILIPDGLHVDLKPMRNRLDEEKVRHLEVGAECCPKLNGQSRCHQSLLCQFMDMHLGSAMLLGILWPKASSSRATLLLMGIFGRHAALPSRWALCAWLVGRCNAIGGLGTNVAYLFSAFGRTMALSGQ
ncbi:hypothetical protein ACSBR2_009273 [Camellia fascicularis]